MTRDYLTNLCFSITFLNLALVGICSLEMDGSFVSLVRLGAVLCNIVMGILLLGNRSATADSSPLYRPYWLGMIVSNILVVKLVDESAGLVSIPSLIFVLGVLITLLSLLSLGASFAVTPMKSKIKTRWLYALVRHPIYLGESVMLLSCVCACRSVISVVIFLIYLAITALRIREEERLLCKTEEYRIYCQNTPWRLLPYIW